MKAINLAGFMLGATVAAASLHAFADEVPAKLVNGIGVTSTGMTLYTFDKDSSGKSACNGQCTAIWPPLPAPADAKVGGDFSVITRDDGGKQIAHKGRPLYTYAADQKPGDATGDGSGGVWHVLRAGKSSSAAEPSKSTNPFNSNY